MRTIRARRAGDGDDTGQETSTGAAGARRQDTDRGLFLVGVAATAVLVAWGLVRFGGFGDDGDTPRNSARPPRTVTTSTHEYVPGTVVAYRPKLDDRSFFVPTDEPDLHQVSGIHDAITVSNAWVRNGGIAAWALLDDGTVVGWGDNVDGRLGHGSAAPVDAPVVVPGLPEVSSLVANTSGTYVLAVDGTVWAWGTDGYAVGLPSDQVPHATPQSVAGLSGIVAVTTSAQECAHALGSDGTVWTWGRCVGGGTPLAVARMPGAVGITGTAEHVVVLLDDGTVWWFDAFWTWDRARTPVQVPDLSDVVAVDGAIGSFAAVTGEGDLWHCQVEGAGWTVEKTPLHGIVQASAGWKHARDSDGTVWYYDGGERWSYDDQWERDGDGDGAGRVLGLPPVAIVGGTDFALTEMFVVGSRP